MVAPTNACEDKPSLDEVSSDLATKTNAQSVERFVVKRVGGNRRRPQGDPLAPFAMESLRSLAARQPRTVAASPAAHNMSRISMDDCSRSAPTAATRSGPRGPARHASGNVSPRPKSRRPRSSSAAKAAWPTPTAVGPTAEMLGCVLRAPSAARPPAPK